MKKANYTVLLVLLSFALLAASCKKNSDTPSTTVEYQITPMNNYFTQITYTDKTGNDMIITDPTLFVNGSKTISITEKPFTARIEAKINNTSVTSINYTLVISVNGEVKKYQNVSAPAAGMNTSSIEYTME